jgi:hypothetical protein
MELHLLLALTLGEEDRLDLPLLHQYIIPQHNRTLVTQTSTTPLAEPTLALTYYLHWHQFGTLYSLPPLFNYALNVHSRKPTHHPQ